MRARPGAVPLRHIPPGRPGSEPPHDPVEHRPVIQPWPPHRRPGQQRPHDVPFGVGQFMATPPIRAWQQRRHPIPPLSVNSPRPTTRSMIRVVAAGIAREVRYEEAQPVGGRVGQTSTKGVDPSHRPVGLLRPSTQTAQVSMPLGLVMGLEDHLPATRARTRTKGSLLSRVLPLTFPLPLSWHQPSIAGLTPPQQGH